MYTFMFCLIGLVTLGCLILFCWIIGTAYVPPATQGTAPPPTFLKRIGRWWPARHPDKDKRWWFQTLKGWFHMGIFFILLILIFVFIPDTWTTFTNSLKWLVENK